MSCRSHRPDRKPEQGEIVIGTCYHCGARQYFDPSKRIKPPKQPAG